MTTVLTVIVVMLTFELISKLLDRRLKRHERNLADAERISLDWTIRMSYSRGALDASRILRNTQDDPERLMEALRDGADTYVMEWRDRWGSDRRETV